MDERLHSEKQIFHKGRAKVSLRNFQLNGHGPRTIREKDIAALVTTFQSEGCIRLNADNFVKVLVSNDFLERSLREQGLTTADLHDQSRLHFVCFPEDFKLDVLHGRRRLLAADRFLSDKWWVADFYSEELPGDVQQIIREEYPNARSYCDGDIYRHIRHYQRLGNEDAELKWRGRLSANSAKELLRLEKDFRRVQGALDRLLPFKGLWESLKLSYLGDWMSVKCPEEIFHYLNLIYKKWTVIMGHQPPDTLDTHTVNMLETLMPKISLYDKAKIREMMQKGEIFPLVSSSIDRGQLLDRINCTEGRLLSLHTFMRDFTYFEACANVLKQLCPPRPKETITKAFQKSYEISSPEYGVCRIQVEDSSFEDRPGDTSLNVRLGYQQLFLAVMRDFPTLTPLRPYCQKKKAIHRSYGFAPERLHNLAEAARKLGFKSEDITNIISRARGRPYEMATREYLDQLQPLGRSRVDNERKHEVARYVGENMSTISMTQIPREEPEFTTDLEKQPKMLRCSRPSYENYEHDRYFLFIDIIFNFRPVPRAHATSLAIQRDIFVSFFGELELPVLASGGPSADSYPSYRFTPEEEDEDEEEQSARESDVAGQRSVHSHHSDRSEDGSVSSFETDSISTTSIPTYGANFLDPQARLSAEFPDEDSEFQRIGPFVDPSDLITELLSREENFILYIWDSRKYAEFSNSPGEKPRFTQVARTLSIQGRGFYGTRHGRHSYSIPLRRLYSTAIRERLILVGPKNNNSGPNRLMESHLNRDFHDFIAQVPDNVI